MLKAGAAAAILLVACAAPRPTAAEIDRLAQAAIDSRKTGVCNIHHIKMQRKLVPVQLAHLASEYFSSQYHDAALREFPNADEYVRRLSVEPEPAPPRKVLAYVCPECRRAQARWLLKHPDDEWGKVMAHP